MEQTIDRSVWGTSTDDFKRHFREYLRDLASTDDEYRRDLIARLEWAFDRWEYWRQKFFANTEAPLLYPFFVSGKRGNEFGHYSTVGDSGQPSVIHLKRSFLMGTSDITVAKLSPTKRLVLKKDHPDRLKFVDQTILHELVHQFLHEAAPEALRTEYSCNETKNFRGHGPLFAQECNRINEVLHAELGFEFVPVRHMKRSHARRVHALRPSCSQFTHGELFFAWDADAELNDEQLAANEARLQQALDYFGGAVEVVTTEAPKVTDFPAPFSSDCAAACLQELAAYDQANQTELTWAFQLEVVRDLDNQKRLSEALQAVGHSAVGSDISPVEKPKLTGVPSRRDSSSLNASLLEAYPLTTPVESQERLLRHINESGLNKAEFATRRFGHKNGQQLSRHLKKLREAVQPAEAAA